MIDKPSQSAPLNEIASERIELDSASADDLPRIVILGGGFGGLCAAQEFQKTGGFWGGPRRFDVTLIDRRNHHLFQPLLYQVATGGLSPANIAAPLRALLKDTRVLLGEAREIDLQRQIVHLEDEEIPYDSLIVATGSQTHYFGNAGWQEVAPGLKTIEDARQIRHQVLDAFEQAERGQSKREMASLLTFVVVGGGPTGVELAGAISGLARGTLPGEFQHIDPSTARVILVEGGPRLLSGFSEKLSAKALDSLESLGVEVWLNTLVQEMDEDSVTVSGPAGEVSIATRTRIWAAGVLGSPLSQSLAKHQGVELEKGGRVVVGADCSLKGYPEVSVIGDLAYFQQGESAPLPGLASVATQQGRYVARKIKAALSGKVLGPFQYRDKGIMATIGRKLAVAQIGRFKISGMTAWLMWLFIHLILLAEFQNRLLVMIQWGWSYLTRNRSARLISKD